jgi:hypothetical protein
MTDSTTSPPDESGGKGELLSDPRHLRADLQQLDRAIAAGWDVQPERMRKVLARVEQLVDSPDQRIAVRAVSVYVGIVGQVQGDYHLADKNARIDAGKATEATRTVEPIVLVHTAPPERAE